MPSFPVRDAVQLSAPTRLGSDCASPRGQSLWVLVTGSWGVCTGVPKRLESCGWPARPFTFALAGDGCPVTAQNQGLGPRALVRDGGTCGTRWGHFCSGHFCLPTASRQPAFPKLQKGPAEPLQTHPVPPGW